MITICLTYFKSLTLKNLEAALYAVVRQDMDHVVEIIIVDNDTADDLTDILALVDSFTWPVDVRLLSYKHGDETKTHSWSTNTAVEAVTTPWVIFTRADYILTFDTVRRFVDVVGEHSSDWNGFVTGHVFHLNVDVAECNRYPWKAHGPGILRQLPGAEATYTHIDAGVWMARRDAFERVNGLDERLTAWGHAQTHFQWKLHQQGTEFVRIPEVLFYHPQHGGRRDIAVAHQQLYEHGIRIQDLWARYEGEQPYK